MITKVKKSRKEYKCSRCHEVIPSGSPYFRGDLNFSKPIIRCTECGLESWEVTTSEYQLAVGEIVVRWKDSYSPDEQGRDDIVSELESIRDDTQDKYDNMPEGLQQGDTGCLLQDRIDCLDSAIDELNNIDFELNEDNDEENDFEKLIEEALSCIDF